jgi:hypothetical protein
MPEYASSFGGKKESFMRSFLQEEGILLWVYSIAISLCFYDGGRGVGGGWEGGGRG